ncbi:MAG: lytic transglycosylase domain-containing protein [Deltaproteobacteria bacterium]|jgi:soluble lytic murein transglycosylase|nr:lytic transglycosylase domain-containing protein [Deltaproteobacteria bacterium]MCL5880928.1 lytic transglycosylase domain-containing protein [Deltaproteobacteria bacterium]MDA8303690.1 lytic transglycosylase domain-containing protein [Deltaproteobacteria bacterium]
MKKYFIKKYVYLLPVFASFCLINFVNLRAGVADIYMRVGKNGTVYFSNVPVSNNYRLYMKTGRRSNNFKRYNNVLYKKIILKASNKYKVSSKLIEAVIKAESGFNDDAVSDKGAEGLMQLMPGTQRQLNVWKPFNPSQNIYGGTKYLKSLIVKYNGNLPLALAAYNAGSKAVKKYGGIPPYSETRSYVDEVMKYYKGGR